MNAVRWLLRLVVVSGLAVDAWVHWKLAPNFDGHADRSGLHFTAGQLFRFETVIAVLALALVLVSGHKLVALIALLVAGGAVATVLLYRYVDVGELGPIPAMYDPRWTSDKAISAIAEGVAALAALAWLMLPGARAGAGTAARAAS
jgi:hypothetical protein